MDKVQILNTLPPLLGENEQNEMFRAFQQTGSEEIRNTLVAHNMRLAANVVQKYYGGSNIEFEDLFQIACIELVNVVEKFNPDLGFSFSTFATTSIKNRLVKPVVKESNMIQTLSLDEPICDDKHQKFDGGMVLADFIEDYDESRIESDFLVKETFLRVWRWVEQNCKPQEVVVFEAMCGINLPRAMQCDEIAKELRLTTQRVYEIRKVLRTKIRRKFFFEHEIEKI